jgi:glycosyltransferase involved in cell wall biosynthesis
MAASLARVRRAERPALVYESHGFAPVVSAEMSEMLLDGEEPSASKLSRLLKRERLVWHRADGFITITRALAVEMVERFGVRPRVAVIHDGVRLDAHVPAARRMPATPTVAYAGHLYPWKGIAVLIDAIARLPHVRGLIIGGNEAEGDLDEWRRHAENLGVSERITFTGLLPRAEVATRLAGADIVVLPNTSLQISRAYTSPLKLFEYMASGRPIVASDLPAIREVIDEDCAVLANPGHSAAFAEGIQRLIDDPALGRRLAEAAARRVRDYTWDRRAERLDELLRHLAEDRHP